MKLERKLQELEALRTAEAAAAVEGLRRALRDRNNYLVGKAATIAAELHLRALLPDLLTAFERFFREPVKSDPQCWAKNGIARALQQLEYQDPSVFLRGLAHMQREPVWGGSQDTAATLRGTCALALVNCRLGALEILVSLTDLLADPEKPARIDAARAIAQLGQREGIPPLRLKALCGDEEPEVTGECLSGLLGLAPKELPAFVARFLDHRDPEVRVEAAAALARSAEPCALEALTEYWGRVVEPEVRGTLLALLGGSPLPEAAEFLLRVVEEGPAETAAHAVAALGGSRFRARVEARVAETVAGRADRDLTAAFESAFRRGRSG